MNFKTFFTCWPLFYMKPAEASSITTLTLTFDCFKEIRFRRSAVVSGGETYSFDKNIALPYYVKKILGYPNCTLHNLQCFQI